MEGFRNREISSVYVKLRLYCCFVIEAAAPYVCCVKPNLAFFLARGAEGIQALMDVCELIRSMDLPLLLDAKLGDIGSTMEYYKRFIFDILKADCCTVNTMLGTDVLSVMGTDRHGRFANDLFVLAKCSNPSSDQIQGALLNDHSPVFLEVVKGCESFYETKGVTGVRVGYVVGATCLDALAEVRQAHPDCVILMPGVGAQGGDLAASMKAGAPNNTSITTHVGALRAAVGAVAHLRGRRAAPALLGAGVERLHLDLELHLVALRHERRRQVGQQQLNGVGHQRGHGRNHVALEVLEVLAAAGLLAAAEERRGVVLVLGLHQQVDGAVGGPAPDRRRLDLGRLGLVEHLPAVNVLLVRRARAARPRLLLEDVHQRLDVREPVVVLAVEVALVHHDVVQPPLLQLLAPDVLLDRVLADEPVDVDLPGLPDAVAAVHRLPVHRGVPVRVVKNDRVRARQREPDPARAGGGNEEKDLGVLVELGDDPLPHVDLGRAVEPDVGEAHEVDPVLENVEHLGELRVEQAAVPLALEPLEEAPQHQELAAVVVQQTPGREQHLLQPPRVLDAVLRAAEVPEGGGPLQLAVHPVHRRLPLEVPRHPARPRQKDPPRVTLDALPRRADEPRQHPPVALHQVVHRRPHERAEQVRHRFRALGNREPPHQEAVVHVQQLSPIDHDFHLHTPFTRLRRRLQLYGRRLAVPATPPLGRSLPRRRSRRLLRRAVPLLRFKCRAVPRSEHPDFQDTPGFLRRHVFRSLLSPLRACRRLVRRLRGTFPRTRAAYPRRRFLCFPRLRPPRLARTLLPVTTLLQRRVRTARQHHVHQEPRQRQLAAPARLAAQQALGHREPRDHRQRRQVRLVRVGPLLVQPLKGHLGPPLVLDK
ncbi:orotidine 5'-phosphate decarboxylase [Babesia caballi]|uniref:Orotidine 5'-phosphate decarboxylase n=1 Tax=Babesia caballi TaxID=5871 RepID=A0AAV4LRM8_BABCB|nr:orotidine 5'-phosphate decarboxylase [Babesia caballi]